MKTTQDRQTKKTDFKILAPTAILGYGFPESSFVNGMKRRPDIIAVDAGSTDPGPFYLGSGKSFTDRQMVKRDLTHILKAGVSQQIPVIVGTAGGAGAEPHLQWCSDIIREIAVEQGLSFQLGLIHAEIQKETVLAALDNGKIQPAGSAPQLTPEDVASSIRIVAQMGVEPIMEALEIGCDVILAGRCYDPAVFAARPIQLGFDPGLALHLGKILECSAIAAVPGSGSDCVLGILRDDAFLLESLNHHRRFTIESTAAHTLYEKTDPYHLPGPGGILNLEKTTFLQLPGGRTQVKGSHYEPSATYRVKLEGVRQAGYRSIAIAGVRDPALISTIDAVLSEVDAYTGKILKERNISGSIYWHVYGKNGVMGSREPSPDIISQELCLVIETLAENQADADSICSLVRSTLLHYGYKGRISTAGNLAFPFSPSDISMGETYSFSIYHLMEIENQDLFRIETCSV